MVDSYFLLKQTSVSQTGAWFFLLLTSLCFLVPTNSLAAASSELSDTSITVEDFITLQVTLEGDFSDDLDTSELEDDFDIDNKSISQNHSAINGRVKRFTQWTLSLLPKRTGLLTIPEFQLGADKTQKIVVQVSAGREPTADSPIQLSAEIETTSPYRQQPVIINLNLLYRGQIGNAKFQFPDTHGAILDTLSDPTSTKVLIGNIYYTQWQQKLMLIPQTAGTLEFDPIAFRADLITSSFQRRPMIRRTAPLKFEVKDIPASYPKDAPWLPAKNLMVSDTLTNRSTLVAQEPFTRILAIKAVGNIAAAIPTLHNSPHPQFKQYPEPVIEDTQFENDQLVGTKSLSVALIPLNGNQATLPETTVHWWNTDTNTLQSTTIEQKTVSIDGFEKANTQYTATPTTTASSATTPAQPSEATSKPVDAPSKDWWKEPINIIAGVAITLWLLTIFIWAFSRRSHTVNQQKHKASKPSDSQRAEASRQNTKALIDSAESAVKDACTNGNPKATADSLLQWFNLVFTETHVHSISALINFTDSPHLKQALKDLETHLYRDQAASWQAKVIAEEFTKLKPEKSDKSVFSSLEPLYFNEQG